METLITRTIITLPPYGTKQLQDMLNDGWKIVEVRFSTVTLCKVIKS